MAHPRNLIRAGPPFPAPGLFALTAVSVAVLVLAGCTEKPTGLENIPTSGPYSATVQRIFDRSCNTSGCHGGVNPGAGLVLTSWENLIAGSRFGEDIIAFRPEESHLIDHLTGAALPRMPLSRDPLPASQIETIRRWVAAGAQNDAGEVPYANSRRKIYVTNQSSDKISVIDADAMVVTRLIDVGFLDNLEYPHNVHVDRQGRYWYVSLIGSSAKVLQFDAATDELLRTATVGQAPANPVASPDGRTLYVTNWTPDNPTLHVLDAETLTEKYSLRFPPGIGDSPHGLCVSNDGHTLFTTHQNGDSVFRIVLGDSAQDAQMTPIPLSESGGDLEPLQIILDAAERFAYVTCFGSGEVRVIDLALDQVVEVINIGGNPWLEALTPDGHYLYVGNWGRDAVDVIDTTQIPRSVVTLTNIGRPAPVFARPHGVAITDDGRYAFVSSENTNDVAPPHHGGTGDNGRVTVIEVGTNRVLKSLEVEVDPTGVAFLAN